MVKWKQIGRDKMEICETGSKFGQKNTKLYIIGGDEDKGIKNL